MNWGNPQTINEKLFSASLRPLTWPYKLAIDWRQWAYDNEWLKSRQLTSPVISVGNLTVGGTGKTPIIIDLANKLLVNKVKVGILSRGYARRGNNRYVIVGNGEGKFASVHDGGDEALLIAKTLPRAVVIVDHDRFTSGQKAIEEYGCQVLLLDDGFQHQRLKRNSNIVLIDYADEPQNDCLLPAGRLREPLSALERATHIVVTKVPVQFNQQKIDSLKQLAQKFAPQAEISSCRFVSDSVEKLIDGSWQTTSIDELKSMSVIPFCGVARPKAFFETVKNSGANIVQQLSFPDHHDYSQSDLVKLKEALDKSGARYLVTTKKDLIKLESSVLAPYIICINQYIQWLENPIDMKLLNEPTLIDRATV